MPKPARRKVLEKKYLDNPETLSVAWKFKMPCYLCVIDHCKIKVDEPLDTDCNIGLMKQGVSWACPYFVKGFCCYKSDKFECALQTTPYDKTPELPVLLEFQKKQQEYIRSFVYHTYRPKSSHKSGKPIKLKGPPSPIKGTEYLDYTKELLEALQPEHACNYWLFSTDPSCSGIANTSFDIASAVRQGLIPTRKIFYYTWIQPQAGSSLGKRLTGRQVRQSLPLVSAEFAQWAEIDKRMDPKEGVITCRQPSCPRRVEVEGMVCKSHTKVKIVKTG